MCFAHSRAERGRLRQIASSRECVSPAHSAFIVTGNSIRISCYNKITLAQRERNARVIYKNNVINTLSLSILNLLVLYNIYACCKIVLWYYLQHYFLSRSKTLARYLIALRCSQFSWFFFIRHFQLFPRLEGKFIRAELSSFNMS